MIDASILRLANAKLQEGAEAHKDGESLRLHLVREGIDSTAAERLCRQQAIKLANYVKSENPELLWLLKAIYLDGLVTGIYAGRIEALGR